VRTAEQVRYLILAAQREGNRLLMALLSEIDLTPAQSEALGIIAEHGPLALKELGDMLVCDSGTSPSRIVDRLVAAGLVNRNAGERDRRQIQLTVTPAGNDRATQVRAIEDRVYDVIDSTVSPDDAEAVLRVLRALTQNSPAGTAFEKRLATEDAPAHSIH
jgi:MarR family transcriptional regulator, organic hydroperoxide resistance regulator